MVFKTIIYDQEDNIAIITLNRPDRMNAIDLELVTELEQAINEADCNATIRAVIITGGSRFFCAGADLKAVEGQNERALLKKIRHCFCAIENMGKPAIAAISGVALGGGLELTLACDFRIVSDTAKLGTPETKIGAIPAAGGTQRLTRLVGPGKAKELVFLAEPIDGNEAYRIGLANGVVASTNLMDKAKRIAKELANNAPLAITAAKQAINMSVNVDIDSGLNYEAQRMDALERSDDFREGKRAFVEKRKPIFKGE